MRTILFAIAAMFMTVTVAEANPWSQFRADQRDAYAAGAQSHYWDGVRRGRHIGHNIASRAINGAASSAYSAAMQGAALTGSVSQKAQKLADAITLHSVARNSLIQAFPSSKRGAANRIWFDLRDGVITHTQAYNQWGTLMVATDHLTATGLDIRTATNQQINNAATPDTVYSQYNSWNPNGNTQTQAEVLDHSTDLGIISSRIDSSQYATLNGELVNTVMLPDGRVVVNIALISEADLLMAEQIGYSFTGMGSVIRTAITDAVNDAYTDGYGDGYSDGYAHGYRVGFRDGVASVTQ